MAQSLKQKRSVVKSIRDRARIKFNVAVAELDTKDKWKVACLGFAGIGNDRRYLDSCLQKLLNSISSSHLVEICNHRVEFP